MDRAASLRATAGGDIGQAHIIAGLASDVSVSPPRDNLMLARTYCTDRSCRHVGAARRFFICGPARAILAIAQSQNVVIAS